MNISRIIEDLKQEYSHIVFPKFSETAYVSLLVIVVVIGLSLLINTVDGVIASILHLIMFS